MAWPGLTKGARKMGIATWANASRIAEDSIREPELEYLSLRQAFGEMQNRLEQAMECAEQAARDGDKELRAHAGGIIYAVQSTIADVKNRARLAGERSFAEAYMLAAENMLSKDTRMLIEAEAEKLIGRKRHELKRSE